MGTPTAVCYRGVRTVTADLSRPPFGAWSATVTTADGSVLGQREVRVEGEVPSMQFGVRVKDFEPSRLILRDDAGREVANAQVELPASPETDCS